MPPAERGLVHRPVSQVGGGEVGVEKVAEIAGVSRGLMYHYFPTKQAFFAEIMRAKRDVMLAMSAPDESLPAVEQLIAGLDVYLKTAQRYPDAYRVAHRASTSAGNEVRKIHEEGLAVQRERIIAGLSALTTIRPLHRLAVCGWTTFVIATVLKWLDDPAVPREELRDMLVRTLFAAVNVDVDVDVEPSP